MYPNQHHCSDGEDSSPPHHKQKTNSKMQLVVMLHDIEN